MQKIIIGVSLGDPAGIGGEILVKAYSQIIKLKNSMPLIIGDTAVVNKNLQQSGSNLRLNSAKSRDSLQEGCLNIWDTGVIKQSNYPAGKDSAICGSASFVYVQRAVNLWKEGVLDALVTLPVSKKAWHLAGRFYSGHTEFLASELKAEKYAMVMIADKIKVLLATTHIPLKKVPETLTEQLIIDKAWIAHRFLLNLGIKDPVIGISALNPHGGEDGLLGSEEKRVIAPAIRALVKRGLKCEGPIPADAIFKKALEGRFHLIMAMYHDQALIPLKTFYFKNLVNHTAGLDMIRTSPGHGTGFDIACMNKADPSSFIEAYKMAYRLIGDNPRG